MKTHSLLLAAFTFVAIQAKAGSVGPGGYFNNFAARPAAADWSTRSITGGANGAADSTNAFRVDTNVAAVAASTVTTQVLDLSPLDPAGTNALATWTSAGSAYLQTRPTGNRITLLMATLVNNTGSNVDAISISYTFTIATTNTEEVAGQRVYYSFTGAVGSWLNIAAPTSTGPVSVTISSTWLDGSPLYVLFADDNGTGTPDSSCQIDDFLVTTSGGGLATTAITISSPAEGQNIVEAANFAVNASTSGIVTNTSFFLDGSLVGSDGTAPYSVTFSNAALGPHTLTAVANNSVTSAPVHVTIVPNNPPTLALTTAPGGTVLVGSNIVNTATISDSDPGGSVRRVEFYLDGVLKVTDTTSPYTYELCDVLVGTHTITAVAVDQGNLRGTNSNTLIATNPADVTILIPNGSTWNYLDKGTDQGIGGVPWAGLAFDDSGWSNGVAELGYGDNGNNRPETTIVSFGPNANSKYITTYFRKSFTVGDPSSFTNLIVRLLRDDGAIVYLNGAEIFRSYMTNGPVSYTNLAGLAGTGPAAPDDGTFYMVTNISNTLISGANVIAVEIHQDAINSSDISFDLMLWAQGPTGPRLTITRTDPTHVELSWPFPSAGYQLEFKNEFDQAAWSMETALDLPDASNHHVSVTSSSGRKFFRLHHP